MTEPPKYLDIDGGKFAYRTCGSGPDILLIHGWQSSGRMWDDTMNFLSPHFRLWAIDLMGFGDSHNDDPSRQLSVDNQTQLVAEFCEALDLRPHVVMGHSMGGCITLKLALDHPDLLDKIVLIAPVVTGKLAGNLDRLLMTRIGRSVLLSLGQHLWPQLPHLRGHLSFLFASGQPPQAVKRTIEDFKKGTWGASYGGLMSLLNVRLDARLAEIDRPTLVITGAKDITIPPSDGRLVAKTVRGAQYLEIPNCRHHVPDECPERFLSALTQFLAIAPDEVPHAEYAISAV